MKLEHIPIILGVIVCLVALGIIYDALRPEEIRVFRERRRRQRAEVNRIGQALVGAGTLFMGAALIGRDTWRYGTVAVFAAIGFLVAGSIMNRAFLRELLLFRGPARRAEPGDKPEEEPPPRMRIR